MITELNNIKEVKITKKLEHKYFMLFAYNKNSSNSLNTKYTLITQGHNINDLEWALKSWKLAVGEEFRTFSVLLPD